ncbi:hypothetical protein [Sphingomonas bacterium]|uniref:hypothetical protein n=1 Tax=Sphingomonas bacterium TaxID=1895847 RepID=UPI0015771862|nr:hypothetical protein [Sphingomonas bacterium]
MTGNLIFFGIVGPLFLLMAWRSKRLRDAVDERHPDAARAIDRLVRALPRRERALARWDRYRMLDDPEVDRHLRSLETAQRPWGYAILGLFAIFLVFAAIILATGGSG